MKAGRNGGGESVAVERDNEGVNGKTMVIRRPLRRFCQRQSKVLSYMINKYRSNPLRLITLSKQQALVKGFCFPPGQAPRPPKLCARVP